MQKQALSDLSSFVIHPYRSKYLQEYYARMSKDNTNMLWDDNVANVLKEQGFEIEQSPRSVYKVEKLFQALAKYAPEHSPNVDVQNQWVQQGIRLAYACFGCKREADRLSLKQFTPELVYSITSNLKGSSGLTAYGQTKAESYVRAFERGSQILQGQKKPEPCIAFKRTQFDDKTRLVWGYPYSMTAIEGIFARPLINQFLGGNTPMSFGTPTGVLGAKLRVSSYSNEWAYSTDVSSFDSSISASLIYVAFDILSTWFDMEQCVIEDVTASVAWKHVVQYFIRTPIVMPDGNCYKGKRHGVPSGSYFTQMIDSIVNVIIVGAISARFHMNVGKESISVLGDDVLFWSNTSIDLSEIARFATSLFHSTFNERKSAKYHFDEPIYYLGRVWTKGVPDLPESEILKRMAQPETFRKYSTDPKSRERERNLLLASYASVYKSAFPIYWKAVHGQKKWDVDVDAYERWMLRTESGGYTSGQIEPEHLSGLQRYLMKYHEQKNKGGQPLALQFWK